jgi:hypothetical protein
MVLYQTNLVLRSGVLPTPLITKFSMCRNDGGQMGTGTYHFSGNCVFLCQYIPRILCIRLQFLVNIFKMTSGRSLRTLYEKDISKKTIFFFVILKSSQF